MALANTSTAPMSVYIAGVPGAFGGLASELTQQLVAAGHKVMVMTHGSDGARAVRAVGALPIYPDLFRAGEMQSMMQAAKVNAVVNLAPQSMNHIPYAPIAWDERVLSEGTAALLEAAQQAGVEYFVHTSYAYIGGGQVEELSSLLRAAARAERQVLGGAIPASVLRMGFLYGASSLELTSALDAIRLGRPVETGADVPAHWTHIGDAARAILLALEKRPAGVTLNVVDDTPASTAEFMRYFTESQGLGVPGRLPFLSSLSQDKRQVALMSVPAHGDNAAAKEALGWQPRFPNYRAGIDDTLLTWRAQEPQRT